MVRWSTSQLGQTVNFCSCLALLPTIDSDYPRADNRIVILTIRIKQVNILFVYIGLFAEEDQGWSFEQVKAKLVFSRAALQPQKNSEHLQTSLRSSAASKVYSEHLPAGAGGLYFLFSRSTLFWYDTTLVIIEKQ